MPTLPPLECAFRRLRTFARELSDPRGRVQVAMPVMDISGGEHVVGVEPGSDRAQGDEGADQQRRADQQYQRQRDFARDQQRARLARAESGAGATAAFLQRGVEVGSRDG